MLDKNYVNWIFPNSVLILQDKISLSNEKKIISSTMKLFYKWESHFYEINTFKIRYKYQEIRSRWAFNAYLIADLHS